MKNENGGTDIGGSGIVLLLLLWRAAVLKVLFLVVELGGMPEASKGGLCWGEFETRSLGIFRCVPKREMTWDGVRGVGLCGWDVRNF